MPALAPVPVPVPVPNGYGDRVGPCGGQAASQFDAEGSPAAELMSTYLCGLDIGGTFTDCVLVDDRGRMDAEATARHRERLRAERVARFGRAAVLRTGQPVHEVAPYLHARRDDRGTFRACARCETVLGAIKENYKLACNREEPPHLDPQSPHRRAPRLHQTTTSSSGSSRAPAAGPSSRTRWRSRATRCSGTSTSVRTQGRQPPPPSPRRRPRWMATEVSAHPFVPLAGYREYPEDEMAKRAREFHAELARRRTVRDFSSRPVPRAIVDDCLRAATTAPSGANLQPWHFVVVGDPETKRQIREAAEEEERHFYRHRAAPRVAGRARPARHRRAQALPRDRALAHRDLRPEVRPSRRRPQGQALLPDRIGGPRDRDADHRPPPRGARDPHPHPRAQ